MQKKKKKLALHGGGKSIRSFIHINDVSEALYRIIKKGEIGSTYHISTNEFISIKNLVKKICSLTQVNFNNIVTIDNDRLGKDQAYLLNSSRLRNNLGWSDKIPLDQGLEEIFNWINGNFDILRKMPHEYVHKK